MTGKPPIEPEAATPPPKRARKSAKPRAAPRAAASGEALTPTQPASPDASASKPKRSITLSAGAKKRKPPAKGRAKLTRADRKRLTPRPPEETSKTGGFGGGGFGGGKASGTLEWIRECAAKIEEAEAREAETEARTAKRVAEMARKDEVVRGVGRPSDYEPWMCEAVEEFGQQGMEVVEFAVKLRVTRQTLYNWADKHAEFFDALTRAREASEAWWIKNIRGQAQMPAQATNLTGTLGYMGRRFAGWREAAKDDGPKTKPVSVGIKQGRERVAAARAAAAEEAARASGI